MHLTESTTVKVTIARLHKLVERLKARVSELNAEATAALTKTRTWRGAAPTEQALAFTKEGVQAGLKASTEAIRLSGELAKLRGVISHHNELLGISHRLAQVAAIDAQRERLKAVLVTAAAHSSLAEATSGVPLPEYGLTTTVLTEEDIKAVQAQADALQRDAYRLGDEIAEANATRVEVTLPKEIAELVSAAAS